VTAVPGLDGSRYTSPEVATLEREQVLLASWQLACHASDLPAAGTALRIDFAGRSAVVLRGGDGEVRGFLNVCRHRGSRIVDGDPRTGLAFCVQGRMRCPYHAWEYDDHGALAHVPREASYPGLDRAALSLEPIAVETWLGFVFIAFQRPARTVASMFEPVRAELESRGFEGLRRLAEPHLQRCQADWKLLCEHRLDTFHLAIARPLRKPRVGGEIEIVVCDDDVLRLSSRIEAGESSSWSARAYDRWLPGPVEPAVPQARAVASYFVWPNLEIGVYPDQLVIWSVASLQAGQSLLRSVSYALPDASREMRLARYLNHRIARRAAADDRRITERVQAGLATGAYQPGPIADGETGLRWFVERMRRAIVAPPSRPPKSRRKRG
jgi:carnitine monooxygenase subunit